MGIGLTRDEYEAEQDEWEERLAGAYMERDVAHKERDEALSKLDKIHKLCVVQGIQSFVETKWKIFEEIKAISFPDVENHVRKSAETLAAETILDTYRAGLQAVLRVIERDHPNEYKWHPAWVEADKALQSSAVENHVRKSAETAEIPTQDHESHAENKDPWILESGRGWVCISCGAYKDAGHKPECVHERLEADKGAWEDIVYESAPIAHDRQKPPK